MSIRVPIVRSPVQSVVRSPALGPLTGRGGGVSLPPPLDQITSVNVVALYTDSESDLSGNGYDLIGEGANIANAVWGATNGPNGGPGVYYNGTVTGSGWVNVGSTLPDILATGFCVFCAVECSDIATLQEICSFATTAGGGNHQGAGLRVQSNDFKARTIGDSGFSIPAIEDATTAPHILGMIVDAANDERTTWMDGIKKEDAGDITSIGDFVSIEAWSVGCYRRDAITSPLQGGKVGPVVVCDGVPSFADIQHIDSYIRTTMGFLPYVWDRVLGEGQSNLRGSGGSSTAAPLPANAFWDNHSAFGLIPVVDPVTGSAGTIWPALCEKYFELTGRGLIITSRPVSGSSLLAAANPTDNWSPTGSLRGDAEDDLTALLATLTSDADLPAGKVYAVWCQGEQESVGINGTTVTAALYEEALEEISSEQIADFGMDGWFIIRTGTTNDGSDESDFATIRAAQENAANAVEGVYIAHNTANSFPDRSLMYDNVHWSQGGLDLVGKSVAAEMAMNLAESELYVTPSLTAYIDCFECEAFFDLYSSDIYQDVQGGTTTPVTTSGDPVGTVVNDSYVGGSFYSEIAANRPNFIDSGGVRHLDYASNDDYLKLPSFSPDYGGDNLCVFFSVRRSPSEATSILLAGNVGGSSSFTYAYPLQSGSALTSFYAGAGTPTLYIDGSLFTGTTRGDLYTALSDNSWHHVEVRGLDTSTWTNLGIGGYGSGFHYRGHIGPRVAIVPQDYMTDRRRAKILEWMEDGVTA